MSVCVRARMRVCIVYVYDLTVVESVYRPGRIYRAWMLTLSNFYIIIRLVAKLCKSVMCGDMTVDYVLGSFLHNYCAYQLHKLSLPQ